jgi:hypothetical protein
MRFSLGRFRLPGRALCSMIFLGCLARAVCAVAAADELYSPFPPPDTTVASYPAASTVRYPFASTPALNDWGTYGYDNQRSGYNPNTTAFTPASILKLHLAWEIDVYGYAQAQPLLMTGLGTHQGILAVGSAGDVKAYDAMTGAKIWQTHLGQQYLDKDCGVSSLGGTMAYDSKNKVLYVPSGNDSQTANHMLITRLNPLTGAVTGQVDVTPTLLKGEYVFSHAALTLANGYLYAGTSSSCDDASWRGRVAVIDPVAMKLLNTFYTVYNAGPKPGAYSGGGVWAWGGVSVAPSGGDVFVAVGNADTNTNAGGNPGPEAPFKTTDDEQAGYGENIVKLTYNLNHVLAATYPGFNFSVGYEDLDFAGTPVLFQPAGCKDLLAATQGKGGTLVVSDTTALATVHTYDLSEPSSGANYIGNPAYSPLTKLLYAAVTSHTDSIEPPGMVAISDCGTSILWHTVFGPDSFTYSKADGGAPYPRTAPVVTAGGVVLMGTPYGPTSSPYTGLWAVDASSGALLNNSKPVFRADGLFRMAPVVSGEWMYVADGDGALYGLTVDPSVPPIKQQGAVGPRFHMGAWHSRG